MRPSPCIEHRSLSLYGGAAENVAKLVVGVDIDIVGINGSLTSESSASSLTQQPLRVIVERQKDVSVVFVVIAVVVEKISVDNSGVSA